VKVWSGMLDADMVWNGFLYSMACSELQCYKLESVWGWMSIYARKFMLARFLWEGCTMVHVGFNYGSLPK
jgi:hypothetical protein